MTNLNPNPAKTAAQHGEFDGADQFEDVEFIIKQGRIKRVLTRGMSKFGINHGGVDKMFSLALYYKLTCLFVLVILAMWLGGTDYSTQVKSLIMIAFCGFALLTILVTIFLYYKLRYALAIIGCLLGCILVLFGIPFLFYVIR